MRAIAAAALFLSLNAIGQTVNLDKPGALASLEKEKPDHYRTVLNTVRATERMNCAIDLKAYQAGDMKHACRSHLIRTSYPAQVVLLVPVEGASYVITAFLDHSLDHISPAK
jgi:hypothetical protein